MDNENNKQINDVTAPATPASEGTRIDVTTNASTPSADPTPAVAGPTDNSSAEPVPAEAPAVELPAPETDSAPTEAPADNTATPSVTPANVVSGGAGKSGGSPLRLVVEIALVVALAGVGAYAFMLSTSNSDLKNQVSTLKQENAELNKNPAIQAEKQAKETITAVSKLAKLPTGETPTVLKVTDPVVAKKDQPFFKDSKKDDIALVYVKANKAYLYRPSTNKIVLEAQLNTASTNATQAPKTTP